MNLRRWIESKRHRMIWICGWLSVCLFFILCSCGKEKIPTNDEVSITIERTEQYLLDAAKTSQVQTLITEYFSENASNGSVQTMVQALAMKYPELDYREYGKMLETDILAREKIQTASLQKACITFLSIHYVKEQEKEWIAKGIAETGADTIMSSIYGIQLMEMLYAEEEAVITISEEQILKACESLIAYQLSDGGFAYFGEKGDADVTAMTLQALAPYYRENEIITDSIEQALDFVSKEQLPDGGFQSMETANSESCAQMLNAFVKLGIDPVHSERFLKNGNSVVSCLYKYQKENGGFSHVMDGDVNEMATSQALQALMELKVKGKNIASQVEIENDKNKSGFDLIKKLGNHVKTKYVIICIIMIIYILYGCLFFHKNKKKWITNFMIVLILSGCVFFLDVETVTEHKQLQKKEGNLIELEDSNESVVVSISIDCSSVLGEKPVQTKTDFERIIPENGKFLETQEVTTSAGDTVFDVLQSMCEEYEISLDFQNNSLYGSYYVKGIGYLYEYDFGDLSGWMYRVNGVFPSVGCGEYILQDGDKIEWIYTKEMGHDL